MTEPLASFSLAIRTSRDHKARKKLRVYVWKHLKDLRAAAKTSSSESAHYWRNAAGAYVGIKKPRLYGEIHLWIKLIGAGYFAHELQHFMASYACATEKHWNPLGDEADERMAWLAGQLTAQFWTKFYERFEVREMDKSDE
jgi:hypothetical protein